MLNFTVNPDDGDRYEVKAVSRDVVVWETSSGKTYTQLLENINLVDLYHLAWITSKRLGHVDGTLKEFREQVDLVFEFGEEPDPTQPAASGGD